MNGPGRGLRLVARLFNLSTRVPAAQRAFTATHARLFARSGGRILARWFGGPIMVLETVGRRSGKRRRTPVVYLPDGDRLVVLPINAGSSRTPAWWLNLRDAGSAVAMVGGEARRVRPRVAQGEERARLWDAVLRMTPGVEAYRAYTDRQIPVVVLEPVETG